MSASITTTGGMSRRRIELRRSGGDGPGVCPKRFAVNQGRAETPSLTRTWHVSGAILRKKLTHAEATEAPVFVSDNNLGCLMQIKGGLHAGGSQVRAMHLMELIAGRLDDSV